MIFNNSFLEGSKNPELAKLLAFCNQENIYIYDYFKRESKCIKLDEKFEAAVDREINRLDESDSFYVDYSDNKKVRWKLSKPLYIKEKIGTSEFHKIRSLWHHKQIGMRGYMGDPMYSWIVFSNWLNKNPEIEFKLIERACNAYLEECRNREQFIMHFTNFIQTDKGSTLSIWIEEMQYEKEATTNPWIKK